MFITLQTQFHGQRDGTMFKYVHIDFAENMSSIPMSSGS